MGLFEDYTDGSGDCAKKSIAAHNSQRTHEGKMLNLLIVANAGLVVVETRPSHQGKREAQKVCLWCGFLSPTPPPFFRVQYL